MTKLSPRIKQNIYRVAGALPLLLAAHSAVAQAAPPVRYGPQVSTFAEFTAGKPDFGNYGDWTVYGFTMGGFSESSHILSSEVRGSILRSGGYDHEETALAGPRAALHFARLSPYLSLLGGGAHTWWYSNAPNKGPKPTMKSGLGLQWTAVAGIDVYMSPRISLRVGELSYSNVFVGSETKTALTASAGVVYRPRFKRPY
ncbi:MAG TPA: hypothetical protein VK638_28745 [Edaphobacter sp.]|nr:hypothetical protein [Edaphobacter sp.]